MDDARGDENLPDRGLRGIVTEVARLGVDSKPPSS
jgi:hypothetical protein